MSNKHMGSSIDELLKDEGILDEAQSQAIKEVAAWQIAEPLQAGRSLPEPPSNTDNRR
jgi:hypothetical protein